MPRCFCWVCCGRTRAVNTVRAHRSRPQRQLAPGRIALVQGVDDHEEDDHEEDDRPSDDDHEEDDDVPEYYDPFEHLVDAHDDERVAEIGAYLLDWMGTNKASWESAKEVWRMLKVWCGFSLPVFSAIKAIAVAWLQGRAQKIDMCRNGCAAFYDCEHRSLQAPKYQNGGNNI
jgi:hypothetical protein